MPKLTYFRQRRVDGGIRSGIELDGETIWHNFAEGSAEPDPTLVWFVDVRCAGAKVPSHPERAPQWLMDQGGIITAALLALAEDIQLGIDGDYFPLQRKVAGAPKGATITIACSAIKRLPGREIVKVLRDQAKHWRKYVGQLSAPLPSG